MLSRNEKNMYPESGGYKTGHPLTRLPQIEEWEELRDTLEEAIQSSLAEFNLELDQVEFTVEDGEPTVNVYYSTERGSGGQRPQLERAIVHEAYLRISHARKKVLGDLLSS